MARLRSASAIPARRVPSAWRSARIPGRSSCPATACLAAGGKTGGFSADGGVETKLRILTIEKARTSEEPSLFDALPLAAKPARH